MLHEIDDMPLTQRTVKQTVSNTPFTRSSKRRANVFKIHVLIARRLLDVCTMFASIHPASSTAMVISMLIRRAGGL